MKQLTMINVQGDLQNAWEVFEDEEGQKTFGFIFGDENAEKVEEFIGNKNKWSVLLLRPDYIADSFGQDTILLHVEERCAKTALATAKRMVAETDQLEYLESADDYYPLIVTTGHIADYYRTER